MVETFSRINRKMSQSRVVLNNNNKLLVNFFFELYSRIGHRFTLIVAV